MRRDANSAPRTTSTRLNARFTAQR
jgi:hypothetical protein